MSGIRRRLSWIACGWLCCQLSLLAAPPFSLLAHAAQPADAVTCTCIHTGNAECPMHHPKPQKRGCECRSATDHDAVTIVSLLGSFAVLVDASARLMPPPITQLPIYPINRFSGFIAIPDGPPPRA